MQAWPQACRSDGSSDAESLQARVDLQSQQLKYQETELQRMAATLASLTGIGRATALLLQGLARSSSCTRRALQSDADSRIEAEEH